MAKKNGSEKANLMIRMVEPFDVVYSDIAKVLNSQATVDVKSEQHGVSLEKLISEALRALCHRLCELGAGIYPEAGGTSASTMVCHSNDSKQGIMTVRVNSSFPSYRMDRIFHISNNAWAHHLRSVHYHRPNDPSVNQDVVARALMTGVETRLPVQPNSNTASESELQIVSIRSLIPKQLSIRESLETVRPDTVVAFNIDFYNADIQLGHQDVPVAIDRIYYIQGLLNQIHELSILQSFHEETRREGIARFIEDIDTKKLTNFTLQELVRLIISYIKP